MSASSTRDATLRQAQLIAAIELFLIPGLEMMTTRQVAEYYNVSLSAVHNLYSRNKTEIDSDGTESVTTRDIRLTHCERAKYSGVAGSTKFIMPSGGEFLLNNRRTRVFPKRAILRIGMLLRDSEVAKEVRTQLLNTFEHATDAQRISTCHYSSLQGTYSGESIPSIT